MLTQIKYILIYIEYDNYNNKYSLEIITRFNTRFVILTNTLDSHSNQNSRKALEMSEYK